MLTVETRGLTSRLSGDSSGFIRRTAAVKRRFPQSEYSNVLLRVKVVIAGNELVALLSDGVQDHVDGQAAGLRTERERKREQTAGEFHSVSGRAIVPAGGGHVLATTVKSAGFRPGAVALTPISPGAPVDCTIARHMPWKHFRCLPL